MPRTRQLPPPADSGPRLRRAYFECRYGQLHVHYAVPPGGGFDEAVTLLCFHDSAMSARMFDGFLKIVGRDRSVYAPDTPGCGASDAPPAQPAITDYAAAMLDFIDTMHLRKVDVLGYHAGALIAAELALARPEAVRKLVLVGVPLLNEAERAALRKSPRPLTADGHHLNVEWQRTAQWGASAVIDYPAGERLRAITQPVLVLRPKDDLWDATARARGVLRDARCLDMPQYGSGLFDVAADSLATTCAEFLRG